MIRLSFVVPVEAALRVLVTGNAGFIGFHLAELLARRGHAVFGLDSRVPAASTPGVEHHACDLLQARRGAAHHRRGAA